MAQERVKSEYACSSKKHDSFGCAMPAVRLTRLPGSLQIDDVHPHLVPSLKVHAGYMVKLLPR